MYSQVSDQSPYADAENLGHVERRRLDARLIERFVENVRLRISLIERFDQLIPVAVDFFAYSCVNKFHKKFLLTAGIYPAMLFHGYYTPVLKICKYPFVNFLREFLYFFLSHFIWHRDLSLLQADKHNKKGKRTLLCVSLDLFVNLQDKALNFRSCVRGLRAAPRLP